MQNILCRKRKTACKINTRGWEFFFCQVPTPFMVSPETRIVVRYHDSIPLLLPHMVDSQENKRFFWRLRASIRNGAFFACTSEPVRQELVRLFPETESTSTVVPDMVADSYYKEEPQPNAVSTILQSRRCPETAPERPASRLPKVIKDPFLFSVSTLESRKNRLLLQAWAHACARLECKPMLVLVANLGWRHHEDIMEVKALVKAGRVAHLTRVPISEMRLLYSAAHAVVCPSRSERFDLSGIEAMLCDTPVLASDIDVHRWVYGDAAVYFKSYDVGHCADQIVRALSTPKDSDYLADLRHRGRQRAALYTRETIGPKWTELFQRLSDKAITPRATAVSAAA
jgi:glycosyltransferase involved in cell wall biosynthesis